MRNPSSSSGHDRADYNGHLLFKWAALRSLVACWERTTQTALLFRVLCAQTPSLVWLVHFLGPPVVVVGFRCLAAYCLNDSLTRKPREPTPFDP